MRKINPDNVHPDFIEGYTDGRNKDCPEPNENRSERYKHSFAVGRKEMLGLPTDAYQVALAKADEADRIEKERS